MQRRFIPILVVCASGLATCLAQRQEYEPQWHTVTRDFVTPHTKWADPLAGGPVRTLMIAPRPCMRDTVELAQRLQVDYDVLCAYCSRSLGWFDDVSHTRILKFSPADRERELLEKLRERPDVIAYGGFEWRLLPRESEYELLRSVRDGTGLVLSYFKEGRNEHLDRFLEAAKPVPDGGFIAEGIPFKGLPAWSRFDSNKTAAAKIVRPCQFRRGRAVIMKYGWSSRNTFLIPPTGDAEIFHLDYYFSLAAKAVLWAAGRESAVRLDRFCLLDGDGAPVAEVPIEKVGAARAALRIRGAGAASGEVWLRLRDERGEEALQQETPLAAAHQPNEFLLALPHLAAGGWFLDAIARNPKGETLNWWSCFFRVTSEQSISEVKTDRETLAPGETLSARIALAQPAAKGSALSVRVTDSLGRVIERQTVTPPEGRAEVSVELSFARAVANLATIDVELTLAGKRISRMRIAQPVDAKLPTDDFGFLCWLSGSREYPWRFVRKILYGYGVDCSNIGGASALAEANIRACPYSTRISSAKDNPTPLVRVPCLTDPEYREAERRKLVNAARAAKPYGAAGYSLGDENYLSTGHEYCWSDTCKAYFRDYLRKTYKSLAALNTEWESEYKSWDEIEPITLAQAREAKREGAFAEWTDHRLCMEQVWQDIHKFDRDAVHSVDPSARVGDEGSFTMTSYSGYDWWKQSQVMDVWNIYPHRRHVLEMIRSFGLPNTYSGTWYGGYVQWSRWESRERWIPWFSVLHNLTAAWWFKAYSQAREQCQEDAIAADLTPFPCFLWTAEEIREIKHGFGKLLLNCRRDNYGVAILYSQRSVHAATIDGTYGRVPEAQAAALHVVEDLGLQHEFVSYEQLADGTVSKRGCKALILPCCLAMSQAEKRGAMEFVKAGGLLIADVRPGWRDAHCKVTDDVEWQGFLGVRFGTSAKQELQAVPVSGSLGGAPLACEMTLLRVDAGVEANGAAPVAVVDGKPLVLVKDCGKGRVVLLNFTLASYGDESEPNHGVSRVVGAALAGAGIEPEVRVKAEPGPVFGGEVITYTDGGARYVALLRDESENVPVQELEVVLPSGRNVYNSRTGERLGKVDRVKTSMTEGRTQVYALLPYAVEAVSATAPAQAAPGDKVRVGIGLSAKGGRPGRHVVRMDVIGPDGAPREHCGANVELQAGKGAGSFTLALNDPAGAWRIALRDVATGVTATRELTVKRK